MPSYTLLQGAGADDVILNGSGTSSVVTLDGATHVELAGLTVTGAGDADAGIEVIGTSNFVTITRNIIRDNPTGIIFAAASSGVVINNTLTANSIDSIRSENVHTWIGVINNIVHNPGSGLHSVDGGIILNDYNIYSGWWNTATVEESEGLPPVRTHEYYNIDPKFTSANAHNYHLQYGSFAVDQANSLTPVPQGGGIRADLGYAEQIATPLTLLFGKTGIRADSPYRLAHWKLDEGSGIQPTTPPAMARMPPLPAIRLCQPMCPGPLPGSAPMRCPSMAATTIWPWRTMTPSTSGRAMTSLSPSG